MSRTSVVILILLGFLALTGCGPTPTGTILATWDKKMCDGENESIGLYVTATYRNYQGMPLPDVKTKCGTGQIKLGPIPVGKWNVNVVRKAHIFGEDPLRDPPSDLVMGIAMDIVVKEGKTTKQLVELFETRKQEAERKLRAGQTNP